MGEVSNGYACHVTKTSPIVFVVVFFYVETILQLRWYHTLQGDNSLKSVERFDHMMFVCRFQASR
jgi:hypothetical protein